MKVEMRLSGLLCSMVLLTGLTACQDDWQFSADASYGLDFSTDTLMMDTVFTGVTSGSLQFMVYNRNDVGLRFDAVMGSGASSPFRINLDGEGGDRMTGLEIPARDSLFCYVSVNIPESSTPFLFNAFDSVCFILESGKVQYVRLQACGQNAVRLKGLSITSDTTLAAGMPYLVYDSLYVAQGAALTLNPGVRLYFHGGTVLDVAGRIIANGKPDSVILMRGDRLDIMWTEPPIPYDQLASQWGGIRLRSGSYGNEFSYCDIHSGEFGIKADSAGAGQIKFSLHSSIVHNMNTTCIEATGCRIDVANSQITNPGVSCVDIAGGDASFTFCTIASLSLWSYGTQAVLLSDRRDGAAVPFAGARFSNCIITGRHNDEFVMNVADSIKDSDRYYIGNSLVSTTDTLDTHYHNVVFDRHEKNRGGAYNFVNASRNGLVPVFALDSLSAARGISDTQSSQWPVDLNGISRPSVGADAGCYQYVDN